MEYKLEKDVLTISLEGELNSVNSESVGEEIDKLAKGKSLKLTYKVKVKNNLKYINKTITAEGKVYQNKGALINTTQFCLCIYKD